MAPIEQTSADDELSIETEMQAKPVKTYDCEFEKQADAYLSMIGGYWKKIDGEYKVSESLISAKGAVEAKIAEMTKKEEKEVKEEEEEEEPMKEEKEWVDVAEKEE